MVDKLPAISMPLLALPAAPLALFTEDNALEPIIKAIENHFAEYIGDVSTAKGRTAIKSDAFNITRSKTFIEDQGKKLADDQKKIPAKIDAARRLAKTRLEALADRVRKPLTDWETGEEARIQRHKTAMDMLANPETGGSASDLRERIAAQESAEATLDARGEEFSAEYAFAWEQGLDRLNRALTARVKADEEAARVEAERAELERLRQEKAAREAKEKADAAAKAQADREAEIARKAREDALAEHATPAVAAAAPMVGAERNDPIPVRSPAEVVKAMDAAVTSPARTPIAATAARARVQREISQALRLATALHPDACDSVAHILCEGRVPHVTVNF